MSAVLVILDGASEPVVDEEPTSLERADTPVLDALAQGGTVRRLRTTPEGLVPGSETGIAVLLGWTPPAPVDRAAIEAAGRGIDLAGRPARRVDGLTAAPAGAEVHRLTERAALVIGEGEPEGERVWPQGIVPPRILGADTVFVGPPGAAAGLAALLGARIARDGAVAEIEAGTPRVVVHVPGPDDAAHRLDPDAKVAALSAADEQVLAPIAAAVLAHGGRLTVAPDHGTDPRTGLHDDAPVPAVVWEPGAAEDELPDDEDLPVLAMPKRRATASATTGRRMTERWVAELPEERP